MHAGKVQELVSQPCPCPPTFHPHRCSAAVRTNTQATPSGACQAVGNSPHFLRTAAVPHCCIAGQPPKRLQSSDNENIQDVMARVERVAEEKEEQRLAHDTQYQDLANQQMKARHGNNRNGTDVAADV